MADDVVVDCQHEVDVDVVGADCSGDTVEVHHVGIHGLMERGGDDGSAVLVLAGIDGGGLFGQNDGLLLDGAEAGVGTELDGVGIKHDGPPKLLMVVIGVSP